MSRDSPKGGPRDVELMNVVRVETVTGSGTPGDPFRALHTYWTHGGAYLASYDAFRDEKLGDDNA